MTRDAYCPHCSRTVQLENEAQPVCPVCLSPLIEQPDVDDVDGIEPEVTELDEVTERLHATLGLYAQDSRVDIDAAAARLIELARGNRAALDRTHTRAVLRSGNEPQDDDVARALDIMHRAVERAGAC